MLALERVQKQLLVTTCNRESSAAHASVAVGIVVSPGKVSEFTSALLPESAGGAVAMPSELGVSLLIFCLTAKRGDRQQPWLLSSPRGGWRWSSQSCDPGGRASTVHCRVKEKSRALHPFLAASCPAVNSGSEHSHSGSCCHSSQAGFCFHTACHRDDLCFLPFRWLEVDPPEARSPMWVLSPHNNAAMVQSSSIPKDPLCSEVGWLVVTESWGAMLIRRFTCG